MQLFLLSAGCFFFLLFYEVILFLCPCGLIFLFVYGIMPSSTMRVNYVPLYARWSFSLLPGGKIRSSGDGVTLPFECGYTASLCLRGKKSFCMRGDFFPFREVRGLLAYHGLSPEHVFGTYNYSHG